VENIERGRRPSVLKLEDYDVGMTIEEVERDVGLIDITKLSENEDPFGMSPRAMEAAVAELPAFA
jgi:histidinol-phosphate aminotransferase